MSPPTLAFDFSVLENEPPTGVERYAVALAQHLPGALSGWRLCALGRVPFSQTVSGMEEHWEIHVDRTRLPRAWWRRRSLPKLAAKVGADLLVAPVSHVPKVRPAMACCRTIHDLPQDEVFSGEENRSTKIRKRFTAESQDLPTIFPSAATQADFVSRFPQAGAPKMVIHHGVDAKLLEVEPPGPALSSRDLLVIGTLRHRRMPDVVSRALDLLRQEFPETRLRWLGRLDMEVADGSSIEFIGPQSDGRKLEEMMQASCLVCPSLIEGFGLPIIEGLILGMTVVTAAHAASKEIGLDLVEYYDGRSAQSLVTAIKKAWADNDQINSAQLAARRAHAESFSWQKSARLHAEFYQSLIR